MVARRARSRRERVFYFISAEGQRTNADARREFRRAHRRAARRRSARARPASSVDPFNPATPTSARSPPASGGDAIFSLFPFPNNPGGVYGANTFTQALPGGRARAKCSRSKLTATSNSAGSAAVHHRALQLHGRLARHPRDRRRDLLHPPPARPHAEQLVLPQQRTDPTRTRRARCSTKCASPTAARGLDFRRGARHRVPQYRSIAPARRTLPPERAAHARTRRSRPPPALPNNGSVDYSTAPRNSDRGQCSAPSGRSSIAGFSPLGVDVFNFPQQRVNNTYQIADTLTLRAGDHSSRLRRGHAAHRTQQRPAAQLAPAHHLRRRAAPRLRERRTFRLPQPGDSASSSDRKTSPALGAPSGFFQTLTTREAMPPSACATTSSTSSGRTRGASARTSRSPTACATSTTRRRAS